MRRRFFSSDSKIAFNIDNYLTIEALEDGLTIGYTGDCEYGIDGVGWTKKSGVYLPSINAGQTISFRSETKAGKFEISKRCNLKGNCMSLLFGDNAADNFSLEGKSRAFFNLFRSCPIVSVSDDFLPATTLAEECYYSMFGDCTSLQTAPKLHATTLANSCYYGMFNDCTSLQTAPELPATTLANSCYYRMFYGCTSLETVSKLPATTLADSCYYWMFGDCTSLQTAPELPATTLANYCYYSMFSGCTSLQTALKLHATTLANYCCSSMFSGCTSLITAPELPATILVDDCYNNMFYGCTKLNYIKMLATDISASRCLSSWVYGVASTGTFVKNSAMTSLPTGDSGIPRGWTVVDDEPEIITFTIGDAEYHAEERMTWKEFESNTTYNTMGIFKISNNYIINAYSGGKSYLYYNSVAVLASDIIVAGANYNWS